MSRNLKPVQRIELSDKNNKLKLILVILLLALGFTAIGVGISSLISTEKGWKELTEYLEANKNLRKFDELYYAYKMTLENYYKSNDVDKKSDFIKVCHCIFVRCYT